MKRSRSLFKYYDDRRWADGFLEGRLRFQTLSRFREWEEQAVRGNRNEGTSLFAPEKGLEVTNFTQGTKFVMPAHQFASAVRQDEIFVFCLSRTLSRRLWDEFGAVACVEILDVRRTRSSRVEPFMPPVLLRVPWAAALEPTADA